jgi:hypothetical protein
MGVKNVAQCIYNIINLSYICNENYIKKLSTNSNPMELHRLVASPRYSSPVFDDLYKQTEPLRRKLAGQINPRLFGVSYDIILSWFDDKFMHSYYRYFEKYPEGSTNNLKGYVINSLQTFKLRVIRKAYQDSIYPNMIDIESEPLTNIIPDSNDMEEGELFLNLALTFLKKNLSENAYTVLQLETNPPPYIISRMEDPKKKIPIDLLMSYLNLEDCVANNKAIQELRREVKLGISQAREYFSSQQLSISIQ